MADTRRAALVTGGTRGIGFGIAAHLAEAGLDLALCGLRAEAEVASVIEQLRASGGEVVYFRADVGETADRAALLEAIRERYGRLDVLVNNAGVAPAVRADLLDATEESFDRLVRINLRGPHFLTQAAARWMIAQREADRAFQGCIVNISSVSATMASLPRGDYCMTKAGLAMSTMLWAARLAEHGILVYEVRPGIIETDMTAAVKSQYDPLIKGGLVPQRRWGTPDDIGRAVAALVRGDLPYSTGAVIMTDGGLTLPRL